MDSYSKMSRMIGWTSMCFVCGRSQSRRRMTEYCYNLLHWSNPPWEPQATEMFRMELALGTVGGFLGSDNCTWLWISYSLLIAQKSKSKKIQHVRFPTWPLAAPAKMWWLWKTGRMSLLQWTLSTAICHNLHAEHDILKNNIRSEAKDTIE